VIRPGPSTLKRRGLVVPTTALLIDLADVGPAIAISAAPIQEPSEDQDGADRRRRSGCNRESIASEVALKNERKNRRRQGHGYQH
jgi:hypothetical protein